MSKQEILHEQNSDIGVQGDDIRSRVPKPVVEAIGGERGDAVAWQAIRQGEMLYIVGTLVKGGAVGHRNVVPPAAKPAAPKTKKAAKKGKSEVEDLDQLFALPAPAAPAKPKKPAKPSAPRVARGAAPPPPPRPVAPAAPRIAAPPVRQASRSPLPLPPPQRPRQRR